MKEHASEGLSKSDATLATFVEVEKVQLEIYNVKNNLVNCRSGNWRVWTSKEPIGFEGKMKSWELKDGWINGELDLMS